MRVGLHLRLNREPLLIRDMVEPTLCGAAKPDFTGACAEFAQCESYTTRSRVWQHYGA